MLISVANHLFISSFIADPTVLTTTIDSYKNACLSVMQDMQVYIDQDGRELSSEEYTEVFYQHYDSAKLKEIYDELVLTYPHLKPSSTDLPQSTIDYYNCVSEILNILVETSSELSSNYRKLLGDLALQAQKNTEQKIKIKPLDESDQKISSIYWTAFLMNVALEGYLKDENKNLDYTYKFISVHETTKGSAIQAMACIVDTIWKGKQCIEVRALVSAPWNLPEHPSVADQANRVKGAGTAAIAFCVEESMNRGLEGRVYLQAQPSAIDFYKKLGFQEQEPDATVSPGTTPMLLESLDVLKQRVQVIQKRLEIR